MTIVDSARRVVGGVDTHRDVNVAAVVDMNGGLLGVESFPTTSDGHRCLSSWMSRFGMVERVGIEGTGADRLLRSLVVKPDRRGRGSGSAILAAIEQTAVADGAGSLYLLTTTAEPFFLRHGYRTAERGDAPAPIAGSAEFRSVCPASAAFLSKRIA